MDQYTSDETTYTPQQSSSEHDDYSHDQIAPDDFVVEPVAITALDCRPPLGALYSMVPANESFWVFGYGSLIWRPGIPYMEKAKVKLLGYHRALCIRSYHHRGDRGRPGLVFGLDEGGLCEGLAFKVAPEDRDEVLSYLYDRELITYCYMPMRLPMLFEDGSTCYALSFVANQYDNSYLPPMEIKDAVAVINSAHGKSGCNREYVINTYEHLQELDIEDTWLESLVNALRS